MHTRRLTTTALLVAMVFAGCGDAAEEQSPPAAAQDDSATEAAADGASSDWVLDADGYETAGVGDAGDIEAVQGDQVARFRDDCDFIVGVVDTDGSGDWSAHDDLVTESEEFGAARNWEFDPNDDRVLLDLDDSLAKGAKIDAWTHAHLAEYGIGYRVSIDDGCWTPGEDLVLDGDRNGIIDSYQSWGG